MRNGYKVRMDEYDITKWCKTLQEAEIEIAAWTMVGKYAYIIIERDISSSK